MANKYKENCEIISQESIADGVFCMWLKTSQIAVHSRPGQFISVYCKDKSRLLPRPISICEVDKNKSALRIVYRIAGKGTEEFSFLSKGETLEILGPLGNGFPLDRCGEGKKAFLIGGGIGIPPMLQLARELKGEKQIVLGYRDCQLFLADELSEHGTVIAATEDGSAGTKGNVLDAIKAQGLHADVIFACGPTPMLRAIKSYASERNIECWLSLEEKMACGIGACLACVCKTKEVDSHSKVHNSRICKDGPVFLAEEVEL